MRLLGVDFGGKRIGIAVGESEHGITNARTNIASSGSLQKDAENITKIGRDEMADAIVVGIPYNPLARSNRMERICLQLADWIQKEGWEVFTVNEAFTSRESESNLQATLTKGKISKRLDGEAARLILERYFHGEE